METEEIIKFLKENLTVTVKADKDGYISVSLVLCDEKISEDFTSIPKIDSID